MDIISSMFGIHQGDDDINASDHHHNESDSSLHRIIQTMEIAVKDLMNSNTTIKIVVPRIMECLAASESMICISKNVFGGGIETPAYELIFLNGIVWFAWELATRFATQRDDNRLWNFMKNNFWMKTQNSNTQALLQNSPHTILLSAFSHMNYEHILSNMTMLYTIGPSITEELGIRQFFYFYITSAYASNVFSLWIYKPFIEPMFNDDKNHNNETQIFSSLKSLVYVGIPKQTTEVSFGASGAISSLFMYYCLQFPNRLLHINGIIGSPPIPAWVAAGGYVLADIFFASTGNSSNRTSNTSTTTTTGTTTVLTTTNVGYGAHLGGYIFGAAFFYVRRYIRNLIMKRKGGKKLGGKPKKL